LVGNWGGPGPPRKTGAVPAPLGMRGVLEPERYTVPPRARSASSP
jgi:hypothetical protein